MPDRQINALECRGVTKRFGALVAVDAVDFTVAQGEVVGIGGPNGAGKTTFFDLISGLTAKTEGTIRYMGQDVAGWEAANARELGRSAVTGGAWAHGAGEASIARSVSLQGATLFTDLGFRVARTAFRDAVR